MYMSIHMELLKLPSSPDSSLALNGGPTLDGAIVAGISDGLCL